MQDEVPEYNSSGNNNAESQTVSSSVPERRKNLKPIMEKKRRARINASLTELKTFLLDIIKKEGLRHNRMEKADILELTVKHLRQLQQLKNTDEYAGKDTFINGFRECANLVSSFLQKHSKLDATLQARILDHLSRYTGEVRSCHAGPVNVSGAKPVCPQLPHAISQVGIDNTEVKLQHKDSGSEVNVISNNNCVQTTVLSGSSDKTLLSPRCHNFHLMQNLDLNSQSKLGNISPPKCHNVPIVKYTCINQHTQNSLENNFPLVGLTKTSTNSVQLSTAENNDATCNLINSLSLVPINRPTGEIAYFIPVNFAVNNSLPRYCLTVPPPVHVGRIDSGSTILSSASELQLSNSETIPICSRSEKPQSGHASKSASWSMEPNWHGTESQSLPVSLVHKVNNNNQSFNISQRSSTQHSVSEGPNRVGPMWRPW